MGILVEILLKVLVVPLTPPPSPRLLLLRRSRPGGSVPQGTWQPITGSVEPGESLESAACRELWEETGISGRVESLGLSYRFRPESGWGRGRTFEEHSFRAIVDPSLLSTIRLSAEHDSFALFDLKEGLHLLPFEHQRRAVQRAFDSLSSFQRG